MKLKRTLKLGDSGEDVRYLQTKLKEKGLFTGKIDENFSQNLLISVTKFQKSAGIEVDGIVSHQTWSNL